MALIDWRKYFDKEMLEDGKLLEKKGRIWLEIRFPISVHLSSFLFILYLQSLFGETLLILFLASGFTTYFLLGDI